MQPKAMFESGTLTKDLLRRTDAHQTMAQKAWHIVRRISLDGQMSVRSGQWKSGRLLRQTAQANANRPSQKSPELLPTLLVQHHLRILCVSKKSSLQKQQGLLTGQEGGDEEEQK